MSSALCPDCDQEIVVDHLPALGDVLVCPHCDADLEVIGVDPLEFDWAFAWLDEELDDEEEDW